VFLMSVILGGNTLTSTEAGYLTSIVAGAVQNSKALVLNSTGSIRNGACLYLRGIIIGGGSCNV
jgi:hypothetical protein